MALLIALGDSGVLGRWAGNQAAAPGRSMGDGNTVAWPLILRPSGSSVQAQLPSRPASHAVCSNGRSISAEGEHSEGAFGWGGSSTAWLAFFCPLVQLDSTAVYETADPGSSPGGTTIPRPRDFGAGLPKPGCGSSTLPRGTRHAGIRAQAYGAYTARSTGSRGSASVRDRSSASKHRWRCSCLVSMRAGFKSSWGLCGCLNAWCLPGRTT